MTGEPPPSELDESGVGDPGDPEPDLGGPADDELHELDEFDEEPVVLDRRGRPVVAAPTTPARTRARGGRRRRRWLVPTLVIVALLVLPFLVAGGWLWFQLNPSGEPGAEVELTVAEGWGIGRIADELEAADVIGDARVFQWWARYEGAGPIQAGDYTLRENLGPREALKVLQAGPKARPHETLALPPGLTLPEIAARVGELPNRSAERFLELAGSNQVRSRYQPAEVTSLEGLLWPETYFVYEEEDELAILQRLVTTFDEKMDELGIEARAAAVGLSAYEAVVAASLIQTESMHEDEYPLVSAVIHNRLEQEMLLQIDATLLYARGDKTDNLTNADKEIDSPYNTYRYPGLPPTPIASVTGPALLAATAPADVPYLFYVLTDENGRHKFAVTLDEHNNNVNDARRRGIF